MSDYVWQLEVTYPDEAYWDHPFMGRTLDTHWSPANWSPTPDYIERFKTEDFFWPKVSRFYLSRTSAVNRANLLESYGARVQLMRSQPLEFEARDYRHAHRPVLKVVAS